MFNKIVLRPKKGEFVTVMKDKILYIKSEDHVCRVYVRGEKTPISISMAIGDFFKNGLPEDQFFMANRSYIVNSLTVSGISTTVLKGSSRSLNCTSRS